jgi:hypothetical protein
MSHHYSDSFKLLFHLSILTQLTFRFKGCQVFYGCFSDNLIEIYYEHCGFNTMFLKEIIIPWDTIWHPMGSECEKVPICK